MGTVVLSMGAETASCGGSEFVLVSPIVDRPATLKTCTDTCPLVIGRTIAYADSGHITKTHAQELSVVFGAALRKALVSRR